MKFAVSLMLTVFCSVYTLNGDQEGEADDVMESNPLSIKKKTEARNNPKSWKKKERGNNLERDRSRLKREGNFSFLKESDSTGRPFGSPNATTEANAPHKDNESEVRESGRGAQNYIAHIRVDMDDRQTKELLSSMFRPLLKEEDVKKIFGGNEKTKTHVSSIRFPCSTDHKRFVRRREAAGCVGAIAFTDKVCDEFLDCMLSRNSRNTDCQSRIEAKYKLIETHLMTCISCLRHSDLGSSLVDTGCFVPAFLTVVTEAVTTIAAFSAWISGFVICSALLVQHD